MELYLEFAGIALGALAATLLGLWGAGKLRGEPFGLKEPGSEIPTAIVCAALQAVVPWGLCASFGFIDHRFLFAVFLAANVIAFATYKLTHVEEMKNTGVMTITVIQPMLMLGAISRAVPVVGM